MAVQDTVHMALAFVEAIGRGLTRVAAALAAVGLPVPHAAASTGSSAAVLAVPSSVVSFADAASRWPSSARTERGCVCTPVALSQVGAPSFWSLAEGRAAATAAAAAAAPARGRCGSGRAALRSTTRPTRRP